MVQKVAAHLFFRLGDDASAEKSLRVVQKANQMDEDTFFMLGAIETWYGHCNEVHEVANSLEAVGSFRGITYARFLRDPACSPQAGITRISTELWDPM